MSNLKEESVAQSSTSDLLLLADDFYFSALFDEEEIFPISDEKYALELHLQEALFSSAAIYKTKLELNALKKENGESSQTDCTIFESPGETFKRAKTAEEESSQCFCSICMERKSTEEMFTNNNNCIHSCEDCITKYIVSKIKENVAMVKCPILNCEAVLEPEICRTLIPPDVFERWETALCESLLIECNKVYCPFKDCSALLVDDGEELVTASECPNCRRLFCAQCSVPWHAGIECEEFQMLREDERGREDIMVMELAKDKKWKRCPSCKFYVDKVDGCLHISCR